MSKARLRLLFAFVPLVLVGVGYGAGFLSAVYPTARQIQKRAVVRTVGAIAGNDAEQRREFAQAYLDSEGALNELDLYSYSVPTAPAPFVNYLPQPGTWDNAVINAHGQRDARPMVEPKPAELKRVFLVGGSTAYGSGAPSQETTIGGYLEQRLREAGLEVEVRTFASPAWTSTHERIAISNRVSEWEPDVVVALSGANDVYWSQLGNDTLWQRTYEDAHFYALVSAAYERAGLPLGDLTAEPGDPRSTDGVVQRFVKNARLARAALGDVPHLVALQPVLMLSKKPLSPRERAHRDAKLAEHTQRAQEDGAEAFDEVAYWTRCYDGYAAQLTAAGAPLLDLRDVFDARAAEDEVFLDALHFGDRGNQWIAEALAARVEALLR